MLWPDWESCAETRAAMRKPSSFIRAPLPLCPCPCSWRNWETCTRRPAISAEARKQYQLVEYIGLLGHINQVLHNRDLALFYADHDIKLDEALALAHKEFEVRHDIYTWDALAWALYKNGKYQEASDAMDHALRPGTRDALLFFHAGMIASRLGQTSQAKEGCRRRSASIPIFM